MDKLHEWCISRQLWWGHQIPAYYCQAEKPKAACKQPIVAAKKPTKCPNCGCKDIQQDPDVLDTWFSSALWPFSVLDWKADNPSKLFEKFYPADVLETGHDILLFWVIRMLLFGYHFTGKSPFKNIYLHGLVVDQSGKKFSK